MTNLRNLERSTELIDVCFAGLRAAEKLHMPMDDGNMETLEAIMATAERIIDRQRQENTNG